MVQNIISGIIAGVALLFISGLLSILMPKNAVIAKLKEKNILRAMRYIATTLLLTLCWLVLPLNKLFVFVVSLLFAFIVLMLVYDYVLLKLGSINKSLDEKQRLKDIETWTNQLAKCDRENIERINMIKAKLKKLHKT